MAYFACPDTGKHHLIFGPSHTAEVAMAAGVPVLAQLPIDPDVAALCDAGQVEEVKLEIEGLKGAFIKSVPAQARKNNG
jgi:hypothetical protein